MKKKKKKGEAQYRIKALRELKTLIRNKVVRYWWYDEKEITYFYSTKKNYSYIKIKTSKEAFGWKCTRPSLDAKWNYR